MAYIQLNDPTLFKNECYVNGEWIKAKSGQTFEVHGELNTQFSYVRPQIDMVY